MGRSVLWLWVALCCGALSYAQDEVAPGQWLDEATTAVPTVPVQPVPPLAKLDAELDEWATQPSLPLGLAAQSGYAQGWRNRSDLSARVWLAWDPTYLYLAAKVSDDRLVIAPGGDRSKGDLLRLWIGDAGATKSAAALALLLRPASGEQAADVVTQASGQPLAGSEVAYKSIDRGWQAEARVPWASLPGGSVQTGQRRAVGLELVDWDADGQPDCSLWYPWQLDPPDQASAAALPANPWDPPPVPQRPDLLSPLAVTAPLDDDGLLEYLPAMVALGAERTGYADDELVLVHLLSGLTVTATSRLDLWAAAPAASPFLLSPEGDWSEGAVGGRSWTYQTPRDFNQSLLLVAAVRNPFIGPRAYARITSLGAAFDEYLADLTALRDELLAKASAPRSDEQRRRYLGSVLINLEDRRGANERWRGYLAPSDVRRLERDIDGLRAKADQAMAGIDPYGEQTGAVLRGYVSSIDDTVQHYGVGVPRGWSHDQQLPLVVNLHGYGFGQFLGSPAPVEDGVINVAPFGRGNGDYKLWCEQDVLTVIRGCLEDYGCDPNRVYCTGGSMGGTGSWQMATMFPDLFAAIGPIMGNTNHRVWEQVWGWGQRAATRLTPFRDWLESTTSAFTYAENLRNVPVWCVHGDKDDIVPVGHSRTMVDRLRGLGYRIDYEEQPGVGHGGFSPGTESRVRKAMMSQVRDPWPKRVTYKSSWPRYQRAYWVRLERLAQPGTDGIIDAEVVGQRVVVRATAVTRFSLTFAPPLLDVRLPVSIEVNGAKAFDGAVTAGQPVILGLADGRWQQVTRPTGLEKSETVGGPVEHAFMSRFLLVYGTTGDARTNLVNKRMADQFAEKWKRWGRGQPARLKADHEVNEDDIAESNLICFGAPDSNRLSAKVNDSLPIRFVPAADGQPAGVTTGTETIRGDDVGLKLVYPNPLNPERYVCLFGGTTWRGTWDINGRFGNWFDWGIFDDRDWYDFNIFDEHTQTPETHVLTGYFDADWRLVNGLVLRGDPALRAATRPRRPPDPMAGLPTAPEIYLSELVPIRQRQEKGVIGYDQSFEGRYITLGKTTFRRGIGIHPESELVYDVGGTYDLLDVWAGIDLEGATSVSAAREDAEKVAFEIWGDGKLLADSGTLRWNSPPKHFLVRVTGVKELRLNARAMDGRKWLFGSSAWGEARLMRRQSRPVAGPPSPTAPRPDRLALDGTWRAADYPVGAGLTAGALEDAGDLPLRLPGSVAESLRAAGRLAELDSPAGIRAAAAVADREWWLTREVEVPAAWSGRRFRFTVPPTVGVLEAWCNGDWVGRTSGAPEAATELDISSTVRPGEINRLVLRLTAAEAEWTGVTWWKAPIRDRVLAPPVAWGDDGGPACLPLGIFGVPTLSATGPDQLGQPRVQAQLTDVLAAGREALAPGVLTVEVPVLRTRLDGAPTTLTVRLDSTRPDEPSIIAHEQVPAGPPGLVPVSVRLEAAEIRPWWPASLGGQTTYGLAVSLGDGVVPDDVRQLTVGFGRAQVMGDGLVLNSQPFRPIVARWRPVDRLLRPDDTSAEHLLRTALRAGFNTLRIESGSLAATPDLLDRCDRLGLMVLAELPLHGALGQLASESLQAEALGLADRVAGHPCLLGIALGTDLASDEATLAQVELVRAALAAAAPGVLVLEPTKSDSGQSLWTWTGGAAEPGLLARALTVTAPTCPPATVDLLPEALATDAATAWPLTSAWSDLGGSAADVEQVKALFGETGDRAQVETRLRWRHGEEVRRQSSAWQGEMLDVGVLNESWARVGSALVDHQGAARPGLAAIAQQLVPGAVWPRTENDLIAPGKELTVDLASAARLKGDARLRLVDPAGSEWELAEFARRTPPEERSARWVVPFDRPLGTYFVTAEPAGGQQPPAILPVTVASTQPGTGGGLAVRAVGLGVRLPTPLVTDGQAPATWLSGGSAWRLSDELDGGRGVIVDGRPNGAPAGLVPVTYGEGPQASTPPAARPDKRLMDHPVLAGLGDLPTGPVSELCVTAPGARVILSFGEGRPLLIETERGDSRVLWLLASPEYGQVLRAWSGWPRLVANLVAYAAKAPYGRVEALLNAIPAAPLAGLEQLPARPLRLSCEVPSVVMVAGQPAAVMVAAHNPTTAVVPFVWLEVSGQPTGLNALLMANGFALAPGETRQVELVLLARSEISNAATLSISARGWGVAPSVVTLQVSGS